MKKIITSTNAPYLLTIFVALTGWTLNEITQDLSSIPVISYHANTIEKQMNREIIFENISNNISFKNLGITIFDRSISCSSSPNTEPVKGIDLSGEVTPLCTDRRSILQTLKSMQPDASIMIKYSVHKLHGDFHIAADSNGAVRVLKNGFWTFLIKSKRNILLSLLGIWMGGIFTMIILTNRCSKNGDNDETCKSGYNDESCE